MEERVDDPEKECFRKRTRKRCSCNIFLFYKDRQHHLNHINRSPYDPVFECPLDKKTFGNMEGKENNVGHQHFISAMIFFLPFHRHAIYRIYRIPSLVASIFPFSRYVFYYSKYKIHFWGIFHLFSEKAAYFGLV